jgi:hypothetical protein
MLKLTTMGTAKAFVLAAALAGTVGAAVYGQSPGSAPPVALGEASIQPAIDGVFAAFQTHPLVGLGDRHGLAQSQEFYRALVRDPRFARTVGNVVVEFGGAARQDVIDRYVNGEMVPYRELRQVWMDTVGWSPTVTSLGYTQFFAQVRETNRNLPPQERIRVWLGEPPIVWQTIKTRDQLLPYIAERNHHPASLITREILARNKKALVIYGGQHFGRFSAEEETLYTQWAKSDPANAEAPLLKGLRSLQTLVEAQHPDAFFIVQVYDGSNDAACTTRFEEGIKNWSLPVLATPVRGTTLERDMRRCPLVVNINMPFPATMPQRLQESLLAGARDVLFRGDAILFLGPAASLTQSPFLPDLYLDEEYRREISRQAEIKTGKPLPPRGVPPTTPIRWR